MNVEAVTNQDDRLLLEKLRQTGIHPLTLLGQMMYDYRLKRRIETAGRCCGNRQGATTRAMSGNDAGTLNH